MRRKPYTERGIRRVPCVRCGKPSRRQWSVCSLGVQYMGICVDCDIQLNRLTLKFMKMSDIESIIRSYKRKMMTDVVG